MKNGHLAHHSRKCTLRHVLLSQSICLLDNTALDEMGSHALADV